MSQKQEVPGGPSRRVFLEPILEAISRYEPKIVAAHLFGSRVFQTGSLRSDIDILFQTRDGKQLNLEFALSVRKLEPYIDAFHLDRGVARSLLNQSEIRGEDDKGILITLNAVEIWRDGRWTGDITHGEHTVLARVNPAMTTAELYDMQDPARERFDIVVIAALQEEYASLCSVFKPIASTGALSAVAIVFSKSGTEVRVKLIGVGSMGSIASAIATTQALAVAKSPRVMLVGIAAGLSEKHALGQVVIPPTVYDYELAKVQDGEEQSRPAFFNADSAFHKAAQELAARWSPPEQVRNLAPANIEGLACDSEAVMASGAKVIADSDLAREVTRHHGKASTIEMEAAGVAAAAHALGCDRGFLVVKAISDFADSKKSDNWHGYASLAAAAFARDLIESAY
jgi:nucleoside phosphorylase/predicted nucleotidyltransferase